MITATILSFLALAAYAHGARTNGSEQTPSESPTTHRRLGNSASHPQQHAASYAGPSRPDRSQGRPTRHSPGSSPARARPRFPQVALPYKPAATNVNRHEAEEK